MEIVKEEKKPVYNPKSNYTWKGDEEFVLTGHEFNFILNSFRKILVSDQAKNIFLVEKANSILEDIMTKAVAEGKIKQVIEPQHIPEVNNNKAPN